MDARATLNGSLSSSRTFAMFLTASVTALALGGVGGYLLHGAAVSAPAVPAHAVTAPVNQGGPDSDKTRALPSARPVVTEQPPSYNRSGGFVAAEPLRDPKGFAIPI